MDAGETQSSTVLLVDRNGQRRLTREDRRHLQDNDLPLPHSIHELGQNRLRTHQYERTAHALRRRQLEDEDNTGGDGDTVTNSSRVPLDAEITPLYPGYGTHFSYVYVGTPPQRQSVIIDTGSHYTAFPCTGCSQCGQHTDSYWDMKNSSTMVIPKVFIPHTPRQYSLSHSLICPSFLISLRGITLSYHTHPSYLTPMSLSIISFFQCNNQPCVISQSYSEGSSWKAIKVVDKLWVGGLVQSDVSGALDYTVDFLFGCQVRVLRL